MKYDNIIQGRFLERANRFIAYVEIDGRTQICHVKNTGRCRELLIPNESIVYVQDHGDCTGRKTRYSLIAVKKNEYLINMDSQPPNRVVYEWISRGAFRDDVTDVKMEYKYGNSRIDVFFKRGDKSCLMEVKGVTLEDNGVARFPDAPTERGVKHVYELISAVGEGYEAYIMFVVQMKGVKYFEPNDDTHKEFGEALRQAKKAGVKIIAADCMVEPDYLAIGDYVNVKL